MNFRKCAILILLLCAVGACGCEPTIAYGRLDLPADGERLDLPGENEPQTPPEELAVEGAPEKCNADL